MRRLHLRYHGRKKDKDRDRRAWPSAIPMRGNHDNARFSAVREDVMARRQTILAELSRLVAREALIETETERRPYETDAF
ncbi:MAG: hypothetical protein HC888_11865, partial [Candidatus Competibacteraceae bacterium]|nr:hypothetical protein [Candidatus Competibacteraceae bacterium]